MKDGEGNEVDIFKIKLVLKKSSHEFAEEVAPLYRVLGWKWHDKIPSRLDILNTLERLINGFEENDGSRYQSHATGGLKVFIDYRERLKFGIKFQVSSLYFGSEKIHTHSWRAR